MFTKNRERLLKSELADGFFEQVLKRARAQQLLAADHFTVDGTLIEAWAGQESFQRKDGKTPPPEDGGSDPTVSDHNGAGMRHCELSLTLSALESMRIPMPPTQVTGRSES